MCSSSSTMSLEGAWFYQLTICLTLASFLMSGMKQSTPHSRDISVFYFQSECLLPPWTALPCPTSSFGALSSWISAFLANIKRVAQSADTVLLIPHSSSSYGVWQSLDCFARTNFQGHQLVLQFRPKYLNSLGGQLWMFDIHISSCV